MHKAAGFRSVGLSAPRGARPGASTYRLGTVPARGPAPSKAARKQAGGGAGKADKLAQARQGGKAQQPKQPKQKVGAPGVEGGLMDMEVPVYAEAFDINKCVDLYLRFFKWVSSPVTGGAGKK
ncbi:hypothetical protein HYH02_000805 [Chlamydomonas schloesseri]|uniref:Uncharacterized protein n=1 Tax=Chlamydomonas schloesseri TaxID=2026947 RepID=A0A835WVB4_9CHLO|nr:hypothetical protein HYH02_000805 [Chlamydomonas schloesseri]|eukprot:KAG2454979.1 hypothetical protein HYH02_000805 [Chlamydomonas schloesseri]